MVVKKEIRTKMRLMPNRSVPCSEDEMQEQVAKYFLQRKFPPSNWDGYVSKLIIPKVYREVSIPIIRRISDVIVHITDRRVVNIECKMKDYEGVMRQAEDHLAWADYSYVCMFSDTYIPTFIMRKMIETGIGLVLWNPVFMVEVLQSSYNKKKNKELNKRVLGLLKTRDSYVTGKVEEKAQLNIFHETQAT